MFYELKCKWNEYTYEAKKKNMASNVRSKQEKNEYRKEKKIVHRFYDGESNEMENQKEFTTLEHSVLTNPK